MCYIRGGGKKMSVFSERVRVLRTQSGLTQKQLGEALGLGQTSIANYEQETRFPDGNLLLKIAEHFDVSLDYLLGRTSGHSISGEHSPLDEIRRKYLGLLRTGFIEEANGYVIRQLQTGLPVMTLYEKVLSPILALIGERWVSGDLSIQEEHYMTAAIGDLISLAGGYISQDKKDGRTALCYSASKHILGVKMLSHAIKEDGWQSIFLGNNLPGNELVKAIEHWKVDLLAISLTLEEEINPAQDLIHRVRSSKESQNVKILLGGRAGSKLTLWKRSGLIDEIAGDLVSAREKINQLVSKPYTGVRS
jgi:methanogenic corrinoid protein MtbC1